MQETGKRIAWIDSAKGSLIILIVLHHAVIYERAIFGDGWSHHGFQWDDLDIWLYHIRLPLFFFISGLLASGYFSGKLGKLNWRNALGYLVLYAMWSLAYLEIVPGWPEFDPGAAISTNEVLLLALGGSTLWYIWALLVCLLTAHLTRPVPVWIVALMVIGLHALAESYGELPGKIAALTRSMPFYLIGFGYPALAVLRPGDLRRGPIVLLALLIALLQWTGASAVWSEAALDLIGLGIGGALARLLTRAPEAVVAPLSWLGQRTLPIYILHFPIVAALGATTARMIGLRDPGSALVWIYAPLLTIIVVAGSLLLAQLFKWAGAGWLLAPGGPRFVRWRSRPQADRG